MNWLTARWGESSTHAGVLAILAAASGYVGGKLDASTALTAALGGVVMILLPQRKS